MNIIKTPWLALAILLLISNGGNLMATEEAEYSLIQQSGDIELRDYAASIVAEIRVEDDFEDAGNRAFRPLFKYISGNNETSDKISMT